LPIEEHIEASLLFGSRAAAEPLAEEVLAVRAELKAAGILAACRAALRGSPVAARNALARHRSSIDPALAKALEVVGSYALEVNLATYLLLDLVL
jgi:hypothetical protein